MASRRMFGAVWRWAGEPRQVVINIRREDWWALRLHQLVGNIAAQVEVGARDPDEIAIDFHHQLVAVHVFPNGNGRHARLAADILAVQLGRPPFSWGRTDLETIGDARDAYRAALKLADAGSLAAAWAVRLVEYRSDGDHRQLALHLDLLKSQSHRKHRR